METQPDSQDGSGSWAFGTQTWVSGEACTSATKVFGWLCCRVGHRKLLLVGGWASDGNGPGLEGVGMFLQGGPALGPHPLSGQGLASPPRQSTAATPNPSLQLHPHTGPWGG